MAVVEVLRYLTVPAGKGLSHSFSRTFAIYHCGTLAAVYLVIGLGRTARRVWRNWKRDRDETTARDAVEIVIDAQQPALPPRSALREAIHMRSAYPLITSEP